LAEPLERRKFTFNFPIRVDSGSGIDTDQTSLSQMKMLSTVSTKQNITNPRFGFPPFQFVQGSMNIDTERLIIIMSTQRAIQEFIPNAVILSLDLIRNVSRRQLVLDVVFVDKTRFESPQRLLLGLNIAPPATEDSLT